MAADLVGVPDPDQMLQVDGDPTVSDLCAFLQVPDDALLLTHGSPTDKLTDAMLCRAMLAFWLKHSRRQSDLADACRMNKLILQDRVQSRER